VWTTGGFVSVKLQQYYSYGFVWGKSDKDSAKDIIWKT